MEFGYKITPGAEYLLAEVWGIDSKGRTLEFFSAILRGMTESGQLRVLIETRTENPLSTLEYYEIGKALLGMDLPHGHKVAAVTYSPDVLAGDQFLETVALNRGIRARLFPSREAAVQWLRGP